MVAEKRNFSKAAEQLYVSLPSLSHCIHRLEQQLGVQLFDRTKTPIGLMYAGEVFAKYAKSILELQHQWKNL